MAVSEQKFLQIYGTVLTKTWADPAMKERFMANPAEVLKEFGLDPGDATITLKKPWEENPDPADATPESQVKLWNDGLESGNIDFYYPDEMPEGPVAMELSAEQLEQVAGGAGCCCR